MPGVETRCLDTRSVPNATNPRLEAEVFDLEVERRSTQMKLLILEDPRNSCPAYRDGICNQASNCSNYEDPTQCKHYGPGAEDLTEVPLTNGGSYFVVEG